MDSKGRIGGTLFSLPQTLLRLESPVAGTLEELLRPIVDQKTLHAATKYLGLLWKHNVHEDLIESVNPLSQIEVVFAKSRAKEVRYLSFSFRRARGAGNRNPSSSVSSPMSPSACCCSEKWPS